MHHHSRLCPHHHRLRLPPSIPPPVLPLPFLHLFSCTATVSSLTAATRSSHPVPPSSDDTSWLKAQLYRNAIQEPPSHPVPPSDGVNGTALPCPGELLVEEHHSNYGEPWVGGRDVFKFLASAVGLPSQGLLHKRPLIRRREDMEFNRFGSDILYDFIYATLPSIFIGTEDRVAKIVAVVSESARLSLKKRGLDFPPWRKPEYIRSKWLAPHERPTPLAVTEQANIVEGSGDLDSNASSENAGRGAVAEEEPEKSNGNCTVVDATLVWIPPEVKPRVARDGARLV